MNKVTKSYLDVSYDLRPAKQVERRMIIDVLMKLSIVGFPINEYQYSGMGSIFFVDHIMFHKYLGIDNLLSVEHDHTIEKRVEFNRPYKNVEIRMGSIGDVIPNLNRDYKHLLWLDYDFILNENILNDIILAIHRLSPGSIILITVDIDNRLKEDPKDWMGYLEGQAGRYFDLGWTVSDFSPSKLASTNSTIIKNAIQNGLSGRENILYRNLFKFRYSDGHKMLTIGGMVCTQTEERSLKGAGLENINFVRDSITSDAFQIHVPTLTRKERLYLDKQMPCEDDWTPEPFELDHDYVLDYRDIYRYYPVYAELVL